MANPKFITNLKHGKWQSSEYNTWHRMIQRTTNPNDTRYDRYGGRGITVCERWRSFENFYADMGDKPSVGMSIERINNDLGYFPENCKWATSKEQSNNTCRNHLITFEGRTQTITQWAREKGIKPVTLNSRFRNGWSVERALTTCTPHS